MNWINPVIFQIGPIGVHWYGVMYVITFILAYLFFHYSWLGKKVDLTTTQKDSFLIYVILGIILGGRLGYILFYNLPYYLENPLKMFHVWEGGLSFHGGVIGILTATIIFREIHKTKFFKLTDIITTVAPLGLFFVRIGNFINGELYGRIADKFCLYFPTDPNNCRYPSQLFQALLEGLLLFIIMLLINRKNTKPGIPSSLFLILYGVFRVLAEHFREPDPQLGFIIGKFTMGQLLSIVMIICGIILFLILKNKPKNA